MEILNSCGLEVFQISDITQVKRFLSLGSENGSYYIREQELTDICILSIERILDTDKRDTLLKLIEDYTYNKKCKKQDPLIYLLARCCTYKASNSEYLDFRRNAYKLVTKVCTIPTLLFKFCKYCKVFYNKYSKSNGWNNLHKNAISEWYKTKNPHTLIYQITKYKDREGYTHKDILRLAHLVPETASQKIIFKYIAKGYEEFCTYLIKENILFLDNEDLIRVLSFIQDYERIKDYTDIDMVISLIEKWKFAREHIPTELLNNKLVWEALLLDMPDIALLRNLNKMTMCNLFDDNKQLELVCAQIRNMCNMHPMQLLIALKTYDNGHGFKGKNKWDPNYIIVNELEKKFYSLFRDCNPTGKRICVAMDVSGSMHAAQAYGTECMTAAEISCALSMVLKSIDPMTEIMGFSKGFIELDITPSNSLQTNLKKIRSLPFSTTDISLPFIWAMENDKQFDVFIVLTDNETNTNKIKPVEALRQYRSKMQIPNCKLIVVAMTANNFSIADPNDKNMLDIAGFDGTVPDVINSFILDEF